MATYNRNTGHYSPSFPKLDKSAYTPEVAKKAQELLSKFRFVWKLGRVATPTQVAELMRASVDSVRGEAGESLSIHAKVITRLDKKNIACLRFNGEKYYFHVECLGYRENDHCNPINEGKEWSEHFQKFLTAEEEQELLRLDATNEEPEQEEEESPLCGYCSGPMTGEPAPGGWPTCADCGGI